MNIRNLRGDTFEFNPIQQNDTREQFLDLTLDAEGNGAECVASVDLDLELLRFWSQSRSPFDLSDGDDLPF